MDARLEVPASPARAANRRLGGAGAGINPAVPLGAALAVVALMAAIARAPMPAVSAAALALWLGHLARRPAMRARFPTIGQLRSLVAGTAVISAAVLAAVLAALPLGVHLIHR